MWRWIIFLAVLCVLVVCAVWLVQNPGDVTLEWRGMRIDTSVGVLAALVLIFSAVVALIYRFWNFLRRTPKNIGNAMAERRQRRGYAALGSGMVAVAAGDKAEARRSARKADRLLEGSTPLTRLLMAQSAQLDGDEQAAEKFFADMLDDPETRFLGLRGLLSQSLKSGDKARALELAQAAHRMRPDSEWVAATLFDLQSASGKWLDASITNETMVKEKLLEKPMGERRKAILAFERARATEDGAEALKHLKASVSGAPDLVPAIVALMERYVADGQPRKAVTLAEKTWSSLPHPDLVAPYWKAKNAEEGLAKVKASEHLAAANKDHIESHLMLARASLDAGLWGEARAHLRAAGAGDGMEPPARVCHLMAELEEKENNDLQKSHNWLVRAATAPADPHWVCDSCGNAVDTWSAHCASCEAFDSYHWQAPKRVTAIAAPKSADDKPEEPALEAPEQTAKVTDRTSA